MRIRFALYTYLIIKTRMRKSDRLWTNMVDVLACFVFVAFSHIGWRLYFIHAKKGMFDKCRGYFEVSSFRENRWTPWYKKIKKGLRRQIVHKYACWRLRLFLCENNWRCFLNNRNERDGFDICSASCIFYKYSVSVECVSNV